jgi:hypothetical protein
MLEIPSPKHRSHLCLGRREEVKGKPNKNGKEKGKADL